MWARISAGTLEWVAMRGWQASDTVPPRLTAGLKICGRQTGERLRQTGARQSSANGLDRSGLLPSLVALCGKKEITIPRP